MEKVVEFLEKHVQWVALGLGALWLLFMGYKYVITPPAAVEVNNQTLTAGKVDQYTVERAVNPLQAEMNRNDAPEMPVQNFAAAFRSTMSFEGVEPIQLAGGVWRKNLPPRVEIPRVPGTDQPGDQKIVAGTAELPANPPAAATAEAVAGRSTIVPPVIQGQPVAAPPQGQAAFGAQPVVNQNVDKDWVTQSFKIPVHAIGEQFAAAKVPPELQRTVFLQVQLIRQEQLSSGEWDKNETILPPIENGVQRVPYPGSGASKNLEYTYLNWAQANTADILQPTFYQVAQGDPWQKPGAPIIQMAQFNAATHVGGKGDLTDEQWQQVLQYRREQYKLNQQQRRGAPRGPRTPAGGGLMEEEGMMYAPRDPDRQEFAQVRRRQPAPIAPYEDAMMMEEMMMEEDMGMIPGMIPGVVPGQPAAPGVPGVDYPAGEFEPSKWPNPEIECWAHDDTVEPGKTYRYKMRYSIKNPLYATVNVAKDPKHAQVFALTSADTDWAEHIAVPEVTNFFIAAGRIQNAPKIRFDIFRYHNGQQERLSMDAGPGDQIGRVDGDVDFTTRWTIVDFRNDGRQDSVILMDDKGETVIRNFTNDRNNPLYQKLKEEVAAQEATAALQPNGR